MDKKTEKIRKAIEKAVREGCAATGGDWTATSGDSEYEFSPMENGKIEVVVSNDDETETTHRFRIVVENWTRTR